MGGNTDRTGTQKRVRKKGAQESRVGMKGEGRKRRVREGEREREKQRERERGRRRKQSIHNFHSN